MEAIAGCRRKLEKLPVTVEFDRLARRVEDDLAVMATPQMLLERPFQLGVDFAIQVT
jgi:hypothetical protein